MDDEQEILPDGYYYDPRRRVDVSISHRTPGYQGLALAVVLDAVANGCNADWVAHLCDFYQVDLPRSSLERAPLREVRVDNRNQQFFDPSKHPSRVRVKNHKYSPWIRDLDLRLISREAMKTLTFQPAFVVSW